MKNMKKGFTLVELLAVLVILAFILLATVPAVSGILSRNKQRLYREQVDLIVKTSKDWALKNSSMLPQQNQDVPYYLSLNELSNDGLIDSDKIYELIKDIKSNQKSLLDGYGYYMNNIADLNGDGKLDFIIAKSEYGSSNLCYMLIESVKNKYKITKKC